MTYLPEAVVGVRRRRRRYLGHRSIMRRLFADGPLRSSSQWSRRSTKRLLRFEVTADVVLSVAALIEHFSQVTTIVLFGEVVASAQAVWFFERRAVSNVGERGCSFVGCHLTTAWSDHGGRVFGEPGRGSMMEINQLRFSSAQPASLKRDR